MAVTLKGPITIDQVAQFVRDISLMYLREKFSAGDLRVEIDPPQSDKCWTYREHTQYSSSDYKRIYAYELIHGMLWNDDNLRFKTIVGDISAAIDAEKGMSAFPSPFKTFDLVSGSDDKATLDGFIAFRDARLSEVQERLRLQIAKIRAVDVGF